MVVQSKLILKKTGDITYVIPAGEMIIWQGKNVHKKYGEIQKRNKDKELAVSWKIDREYVSV